ncbi:MAG: hypothetical protein EOO25_21360 [Comamonadaceae bacterium]|nr:MAG: hypothetical protein EOO25_21360 [Comamonadaceae bacterium]
MTRHPPSTTLHRAATLALLAVFVLAQTLGWLHRAAHGGSLPAQPALAALGFTQAAAPETKAFGHDAGTAECRLYDAVAQPGCAPAPLLVLPIVLPASVVAATLGDFVARWAALFDARGPPASR